MLKLGLESEVWMAAAVIQSELDVNEVQKEFRNERGGKVDM